MEIIRVTAIDAPAEARSKWVRDTVKEALALNLVPAACPLHLGTSFTVTMPALLAQKLNQLATEHNKSVGHVVCGLIEAYRAQASKAAESGQKAQDNDQMLPGQDRVRPILLPLLARGDKGVEAGKIVFAEAATGTGKGNMIASIAAAAARRGDNVVIAAPLPVTWGLLNALAEIPETSSCGVSLVLGRANFVSPSRTVEWASENNHDLLIQWIDAGGKPTSTRLQAIGEQLGYELCFLLEEALALAPDLPVDYCLLDADDDPEECPAEALYLRQRQRDDSAAIIVCSHHMLAASTRMKMVRGIEAEEDYSLPLPSMIDTLVVDEAHLLESAFAAINQHSLRLRPLIRVIQQDLKNGKTAVIKSLEALFTGLRENAPKAQGGVEINDIPHVKPLLEGARANLAAIKPNALPANARLQIRLALRALDDALSGFSRVRIDLSPVKRYPMLISGRSSLKNSFAHLWDNVAGALLTSATLFTDGENPNLIRWKLEIPHEHCLFLPAVHPAWVTRPVTLQPARVSVEPDDSDAWADEAAQLVLTIANQAKGGTLVLCTSHQNASQLEDRLREDLKGRLIVQSGQQGAGMCELLFRTMYESGVLPVWIGVGAAWTGIDLTDRNVEPNDDRLLTDLVIARLPIGLNRSLTHERRERIGGFRITAQEAVWQFRQGLGRLVRRDGVRQRQLWVLDSRVDSRLPWVSGFKRLLARYTTNKIK